MLLSTAIAVMRESCGPHLLTHVKACYAAVVLPLTNWTTSPLLLVRAHSEARAHRARALNPVIPTGVASTEFLNAVSYDDTEHALKLLAILA